MRNTARQTRENRTLTIDFQNEATYFQLLGDGKAFLECILAFVLELFPNNSESTPYERNARKISMSRGNCNQREAVKLDSIY